MASKPKRSPFDVPLDDEQKTHLGLWLSWELNNAIDSRSANELEVDYWHSLYEQARTRTSKTMPWPDAADLTSYLACEKVDALQARIMRTVWVSPVWTVEGWGASADRAPFVEEFHQWKAEEERLQQTLDKAALTALIEPRALIEVSESSERRQGRKTIQAKVQTTLDGGVLFDEKGQPALEKDAQGQHIEAQPQDMAVTTVVDSSDVIRTGPQYRVLPYRDSLILPGHARDKDEIWGYAKRVWKRRSDLQAQAKQGVYDVDAVEKLAAVSERETTDALDRAKQSVAPQDSTTVEHELWEALVLIDVNAILEAKHQDTLTDKTYSGARWYLITIHLGTHTVLRFQHDDFEQSRYIPVILFPRPDRATEGFSFIGHKLITTIEEHTAWRNLVADRLSLVVSAPIKRLTGALWDPDEQPFGPKAVIDVRDMREVEPFAIPEIGLQAAMEREQNMERTAERLSGINDVASGQVAQESRTLGEIQMATEQSYVRMDLIVRRFQEAMEDLAQVRHAIWKRVLAEQPAGIDAPESVLVGLEGRGVPIDQYLPDGKITSALLDGAFRFKPYGSVANADPNRRKQNVQALMQAIPALMQLFPIMAPVFQTPQAARAVFREVFRALDVQNVRAFLGSPSQDLMQPPILGAGGLQGMGPLLPGMSPGMPQPGMPMPPGMPPGPPQVAPGRLPGPPLPPGGPAPLPMMPGPTGPQ